MKFPQLVSRKVRSKISILNYIKTHFLPAQMIMFYKVEYKYEAYSFYGFIISWNIEHKQTI